MRRIFAAKFTPIFYRNKNPDHKPTLDRPAKGSKTTSGEFYRGVAGCDMVFQFEAALRPSMRVFDIYACG
jgi:hypothetical protein